MQHSRRDFRPAMRAIGLLAAAAMALAACTSGGTAHHAPGDPAQSGIALSNGGSSTAGSSASTGGTAPSFPSATAGQWRAGKPVATLPVKAALGDANQVITVSALNLSSTTAVLQAWQKTSGKWTPYGPPVQAFVGAHGLSTHETEGATTTPVGSFTLTQAFGRWPNVGLRLPYHQTTPKDWWISQPGPLYNTFQSCLSRCAFNLGSPNAELYYVQPQYDLAIVINYNRFPVEQGLGSGIFLHVTRGRPTNGCISIDPDSLRTVARWLDPAQHPRIVIGVGSQHPS